jgi:hypothetical protein
VLPLASLQQCFELGPVVASASAGMLEWGQCLPILAAMLISPLCSELGHRHTSAFHAADMSSGVLWSVIIKCMWQQYSMWQQNSMWQQYSKAPAAAERLCAKCTDQRHSSTPMQAAGTKCRATLATTFTGVHMQSVPSAAVPDACLLLFKYWSLHVGPSPLQEPSSWASPGQPTLVHWATAWPSG